MYADITHFEVPILGVYWVVWESMMKRMFLTSVLALGLSFAATPASAVVYCERVGVPKGCVVRPVATPGVGAPGVGVGAPGVGVWDPGINQPGAAGNVGATGVGVGAPGVGVVDPGINQPGAAGNVGGAGVSATNQNGGVNRAGVRR